MLTRTDEREWILTVYVVIIVSVFIKSENDRL